MVSIHEHMFKTVAEANVPQDEIRVFRHPEAIAVFILGRFACATEEENKMSIIDEFGHRRIADKPPGRFLEKDILPKIESLRDLKSRGRSWILEDWLGNWVKATPGEAAWMFLDGDITPDQLELNRPEIRENLGSYSDRDGCLSVERTFVGRIVPIAIEGEDFLLKIQRSERLRNSSRANIA